MDAIVGQPGASAAGFEVARANTEPTNDAERAAMAAEQMGEFFIPGAATTRLAKGGLAARTALEAASSGGVAAAQTGGNVGETAAAAAFGAAGPLTAKVGEMAAPAIRRLAETQYARALNATTKPLKRESARIVPELLDRNVRGTLDDLAERGTEGARTEGAALNQAYTAASNAGAQSKTAPIIQDLEKVKQRFYAKTNAGAQIPVNPAAIAKVEAMQDLVAQFGAEARPDQLWAMRKNIDDIISDAGGFGGPVTRTTAKALQTQARTAMQKELNKASPDIQRISAEFSLWKGLQDVAKATIDRKQGQSGIVELGLRTGIGGSLGLLMGDDPKWGTVGAALGAVTKHPLYRTVSASEKARLAHALSQGQAETAATMLSRILAGFSTERGGPSAAHTP
jgi:hypothetical protein